MKALRRFATAAPSRKSKEGLPRVVILGTGWGGVTLASFLDPSKYDVRMVSPANHFLFTPLLPSTAVGTLEFRAIQEPVRNACRGISEYYQAKARSLDTKERIVTCEDLYTQRKFQVSYDYLVIATGAKTNTFKTPGVAEREGRDVFFLKHLYHARGIRNRIIECFERASNPTISLDEQKKLLSFVIVGAGPTSCEFTTELSDFIVEDVARWYPELVKLVQITLLEASSDILGPFDASLREYYQQFLLKRNIKVMTGVGAGHVTGGTPDGLNWSYVNLSDGSAIPFGMLVWSAGLSQVKFIENSDLARGPQGRVAIDEYLRVAESCGIVDGEWSLDSGNGRVFALGDCACDPSAPLPATAGVAEQQGQYLADCFNKYYKDFDPKSDAKTPLPGPVVPSGISFRQFRFLDALFYKAASQFTYVERGKMASMGFGRGIAQIDFLPGAPRIKGAAAFLAWRSAYFTKQMSGKNRMLILMFWFKSAVFGRDISRF